MYDCYDCGDLDKSRKNVFDKLNYQYGCNHRGTDKYMCGWCKSDNELKLSHLGCSDWKPKPQIIETDQLQGQMNLFDFIGV